MIPSTKSLPEPTTERSPKSPHVFERASDGSVRVRLRLAPDEATLIEEGAGQTPLMLYIHRVLNDRARYHVRKRAQVEAAQAEQTDGAEAVAGHVDDQQVDRDDKHLESRVAAVRFSHHG